MYEAPSNNSRSKHAIISFIDIVLHRRQCSEQGIHTAHIFFGVNLAGSSRGRAGGAGARATTLLPSSIIGGSTAAASRLDLPAAPVNTNNINSSDSQTCFPAYDELGMCKGLRELATVCRL